MIDPFISAFFQIFWTLFSGIILFGTPFKKVAFWASVIVALIIGFLFTTGAYHLWHAYLNPMHPQSWGLICAGFVWSTFLASPTIILAKLLLNNYQRFSERIASSIAAAILQIIICIFPSIGLLIVFSIE